MLITRLNLLTGFSIFSCGFIFGQDLTTGLVAYYPFNGNANDESGNGNATEIVGATLTTDKDGNPNQAYSFDGVDDYIKCSIGAYQEVSVSLWYRSDETHVAGDRPQTRQPYPTIFRYGGSQPGNRYVSVELSETDWGNSFNATVDYAFGRQHRIDLAGPLEQGIWRHAVVVKSASELTLYLDGKLIDSVSSNALLTGSDLYLGSSSIQTNTQNTDFLGAIDELRVYDRALTAVEVSNLSEQQATPLMPFVQLAALYESPPGESITIDATPTAGFPAEFTYQWRFNGFTIPENFGGTASSINIISTLANEGTWGVTVTNETGSIDKSFEYRVYIDSDLDGLSDGFEELISQTDINNPDSDSDGLIDTEEVNGYYTNPNSPDSDSDGFTDLYEVQTAYDPNSDESFPDAQVDIMTAIEVSFSAALGKIYEIQFSVDTVDWAVVETDIVGEGNAIERLYSKKDFPKGFFRVEQKDQ